MARPSESFWQLRRIWIYLWDTYKENGGVPRHISDAISLIQERITTQDASDAVLAVLPAITNDIETIKKT